MLEYIVSLFLLVPGPSDAYTNIVNTLTQIVNQNPGNAQLFELGVSDSGRKIVGIRIGSGDTADLIVGAHHGNEYGSTAVAMGAAADFARNPLPGHTVYIVPVLNIGGYNTRSRFERTARGTIDPNRDYPSPCGTSGPFYSKATKALADFVVEKHIVSSATLHTYSPAVLYPWGISTRDTVTPHEATFVALSRAATVESRYQYGNSKDILYAADGTFEDFVYWKYGVWSLLFEMGRSHSPSQNDIREMVETNVPGLRRFFSVAPKARATNTAFTGRCDTTVMQRVYLE